MKLFVLAALVLVTGAFDVQEEWQQFNLDHGKTYRSLREEKIRFSIFQDNLQKIQEHNEKYDKGEVTYAMKITQFADMTHQEFLNLLNQQSDSTPSTAGEKFVPKGTEIPKSKDWRKEGAVTPVKNQGANCTSGDWAFSATGAIEGQLFRKNGTLISLSEQNLMDCDRDTNVGCSRGLTNMAYLYVRAHGISTEADYPYKGRNGDCHQQANATVKITGYVDVDKNEDHLVEALATVGPISVMIDGTFAQFYSHGIIDEHNDCDYVLSLSVLLVGYDEEKGVPYYIAKNSWGADWGEKGYFRLKRNIEVCGVQKLASYPKM